MDIKVIALLMVCIIGAAMMGGCIDKMHPSKYGTGSYEIQNDRIDDEYLQRLYVKGEVKNTGETMMEAATIRVKFYSESGELLDEGEDFISELYPGETEEFSVIYCCDRPKQMVSHSGNGYTIEVAHPIYDNREH